MIEPSVFTKILALGVEEQRVNVILSFIDPIDPIEKWSSLGDAFRVEAAIIIDSANDVITVPLSALFRKTRRWAIFKVVGGKAKLQHVSLGKRNDYKSEIKRGIELNDMVIIHPNNAIFDGVSVVKRK